MLKEKTLSLQNRVEIFQEVSFYQILLFLEIKLALLLQIEQIFSGSITITLKIQGGVVNEQSIIGKTD